MAAWLASGMLPRVAHVVTLLTFTVFAAVALGNILAGRTSCDCFGEWFAVDPRFTFGFDIVAIVALILVRPPVRTGPISMNEIRARGWVAGAVVVAAAIGIGVTIWLFAPNILSDDEPLTPGQTVTIDPGRWVGGTFGLLNHTDIGRQLRSGSWVVVLHRSNCDPCREAIPRYLARAYEWQAAGKPDRVALLEVPPFAGPAESTDGVLCPRGRLTDVVRWVVPTPLFFRVENGQLVEATNDPERYLRLHATDPAPANTGWGTPDGFPDYVKVRKAIDEEFLSPIDETEIGSLSKGLRAANSCVSVGKIHTRYWSLDVTLTNSANQPVTVKEVIPVRDGRRACCETKFTAEVEPKVVPPGATAVLKLKGDHGVIGGFSHRLVLKTDAKELPAISIPVRGVVDPGVYPLKPAYEMREVIVGDSRTLTVPLLLASGVKPEAVRLIVPAGEPVRGTVHEVDGKPELRLEWTGKAEPGWHRTTLELAATDVKGAVEHPLILGVDVVPPIEVMPPMLRLSKKELADGWTRRLTLISRRPVAGEWQVDGAMAEMKVVAEGGVRKWDLTLRPTANGTRPEVITIRAGGTERVEIPVVIDG